MKNRIISILAFIVAMLGARFGMEYVHEWRASNTVERQMTELRIAAEAENPDPAEYSGSSRDGEG